MGLLLGNVGQDRSLVAGFKSIMRIGCNWVTVTFSAMRSNTDYDKKAYILLPSCDLGPAIGGGRQSFQGRPTPTDTGFENYLFIFVFNFINIGIIIRRRRSAKRRAKRSSQVADLQV